MSSLRDQQQRFARALLGGSASRSDVATAHAAHPAQRITIYRNTIQSSYRNALRVSYPVVHRLVGRAFFDTAVDAFVRAHPSTVGDLNLYGAEFADFLSRYPYAQDLPYLADVARLEWAIDEAHRAAEASRSPQHVLDVLAAVPAESLPCVSFHLDASCRLVASWFPVLRIWRVNQAAYTGDAAVELDAGADRLLVRRDAGTVVIDALDLATFRWLGRLAAGASLAEALEAALAADQAFDLSAALRAHIARGTLASVHFPDVR